MLYLTKLNNSYWIRPDGAEFPFDVLGEHSEEASKYVKSGECNEDPQICLLKEGWIAQRENSFLVWNLTRNEKEIIWERSKRFSFDKIFVDSFMVFRGALAGEVVVFI